MRDKCVSVIVPIYNSADYLDNCIKAIRSQTYTNLQIILVNDGSDDSSKRICDWHAKEDSRIEVYHLENRGVSAARNYALTCVQGEYIQFVDSDDMIKPEMTEVMVKAMEAEPIDMAVCNYIKTFKSMNIKNEKMEVPGLYTNKEYLISTLRDPGHHYYGVVWNKIYRADVIKKHHIWFCKDAELGEDFIFNLEYWIHCGDVKVIEKYLYYYRKERDITLSHIKYKMLVDCQKELKNRKIIFKHYVRAFQEMDLYKEYETKIFFYWVIFFVRQWRDMQYEYRSWSRQEKAEWKKELFQDANIKKSMKIIPKREIVLYDHTYMRRYWVKRICKQISGII